MSSMAHPVRLQVGAFPVGFPVKLKTLPSKKTDTARTHTHTVAAWTQHVEVNRWRHSAEVGVAAGVAQAGRDAPRTDLRERIMQNHKIPLFNQLGGGDCHFQRRWFFAIAVCRVHTIGSHPPPLRVSSK